MSGSEEPEVTRRPDVDALSREARDLLAGIVVLGADRVALVDVAAVSGVASYAPVEALEAAGMIQVDNSFGVTLRLTNQVLLEHAYRQIPGDERRRLHARAAAITDGVEGLRHRMLAASGPDPDLAHQLEQRAGELHRLANHRQAAELFDWSARLSPLDAERTRRHIESAIEQVLAGDVDSVEPMAEGLDDSADARLLLALIDIWRGRWRDALERLTASDEPLGPRACALAALASMRVGAPTEVTMEYLRGAAGVAVDATAFSRFVIQTQARVAARDPSGSLADPLTGLPDLPTDVPGSATYALAVRGTRSLLAGQFGAARADLTESARRLRLASQRRGDGMLQTLLGATYWFSGELELADSAFDLGRASAWDADNPAKLAFGALGPIGAGDFHRGDRALSRAREGLSSLPWREGISAYLIARTIRLHAGDDEDGRAAEADQFRQRFGLAALDPDSESSTVWLVHRGLLALWSGDDGALASVSQHLGRPDSGAAWTKSAAAWLRLLEVERRGGDPRSCADMLLHVLDDARGFPLLHAHAQSDLGRITHDEAMRARARRAYGRLGVVPYLSHELSGVAATNPDGRPAAQSDAAARGAHEFGLSDRESEVIELVVNGMSYAQIARELYVSASTVKFHLSRIYAKTGVRGRHELADAFRAA